MSAVIRPLLNSQTSAVINRFLRIGRPSSMKVIRLLPAVQTYTTTGKKPTTGAVEGPANKKQTSSAGNKKPAISTPETANVKDAIRVTSSPKPAVVAANLAAGNTYEAPEYYEHGTFSYNDYEIDMMKMRIPQPSSKQRPA